MYLKDESIRIALGLNNCVDFEIRWNSTVLENLIKEFHLTRKDVIKYSTIADERELLGSIMYQLESGEGLGCKVKDVQLINNFAKNFSYKVTVGGAGLRAAIAISKFGYKSLLHLVSQGPNIRRLIPHDCEYYCATKEDAEYPHLIIQFNEGMEIHANDINIVSKRANRAMYFNDKGIATLPLDEDFFKAAGECNTLLIGSFTSVDDHALAMEKVRTVSSYIDQYLSGSVIYYEDSCPPGGFTPELNEIWTGIVPKATIYGMNEDELQQHIGRKIDLMDPEQVVSAIEEITKTIKCKNYVVHSKLWAIAYGEKAQKFREPLQFAVDGSTTRLLNGDDMTLKSLFSTQSRKLDEQGLSFKEKIESTSWPRNLVCVPSYKITERNLTTIGLGDCFVGCFLAKLSELL